MSTEKNLYEKSPFGQHYIIHLQGNDEICLHALSILQADLLSCYLPVYKNFDDHSLCVNLNGCIPLRDLKGKDRSFVNRHYRSLFTSFFSEIIRSLNYALPLSGICCLEEHLYYHRFSQKIVCIYLPLKSKLQGHKTLLSDYDENAFEELLRIPYERKWISPRATEELYRLFRNDDECSVSAYIQKLFWEHSKKVPDQIRQILSLWGLIAISSILFSGRIRILFHKTVLASLPNLFFLLSTVLSFYVLITFSRQNTKSKNAITESKQQRRKTRNAQMLFPIENEKGEKNDPFSETLFDPIHFQEISASAAQGRSGHQFTIWTDEFVVGEDSDCCDYPIGHHHLSLQHAIFVKDPTGLYVQDLGSGSGTFVNRRRLMKNEKVYLEDGDILGLGDMEFRTSYLHGVN